MKNFLIILFSLVCFCGCQNQDGQRYQLIPVKDRFVIIDTKTGEVWASDGKNEIVFPVVYAGRGDQWCQKYKCGYTAESSRISDTDIDKSHNNLP
jgi:hypothetical protein